MPLAAKKNPRTEKTTPAQIDQEPLAAPQQEEAPAPPRVTALLYSYNNAAALRKCLADLERSTDRANLEILVVDKGSQDESPALDAEFPNTTFLRLPRNFGNTKALNIATRTAVGEFIFFLSPEIEVAPETAALLLAYLEANPDAVAACPLILGEDGCPVEQIYRLPQPKTGASLTPAALPSGDDPAPIECATLQALMARKYFIRGINYFDERYGEYGADVELCYQVQRAGRKIALLPRVKVKKGPAQAPRTRAAEALLEADRLHGTAVYFGKHYGFMSGLRFRIQCIFKALLGFQFSVLGALLSGQKIDGSQSITL
jgi:glycosyltransferase involved in cell wall biosynthesis